MELHNDNKHETQVIMKKETKGF